jgi:antitoxin HicB
MVSSKDFAMNRSVEYYMGLPYTIELHQSDEESWFVRVKELPGCMSQGDTAEEALANIHEVMPLWIETALESEYPIPEPRPAEEYSGKFVVRVPRSLHRELVERAADEGVSLNQYVNVALAGAVGQAPSAERARAVRTGNERAARGGDFANDAALRDFLLRLAAGDLVRLSEAAETYTIKGE